MITPTAEDASRNLAEYLRQKRGGMALHEVSYATGVSVATLSRIERGYTPSMATYNRLMAWLDSRPALVNPHETTDHAHIQVDKLCDALKRDLHATVQGCANYQKMYEEQKALADQHRDEARRLQAERDKVVNGPWLDAQAELVALQSERDELRARQGKGDLDRLLAIIDNRLAGSPDMSYADALERVLSDYQSGFDPRKRVL